MNSVTNRIFGKSKWAGGSAAPYKRWSVNGGMVEQTRTIGKLLWKHGQTELST